MLFGGTGKLNPESSQDFNYLNEAEDNQMVLELDPVYIKKMRLATSNKKKQNTNGSKQELLHY